MYKYRFELTMVPMNQQRSRPLPPQQFVNFSTPMQQPLGSANTMVCSEGYYDGSSFYTGPVYQRMAPIPSRQVPHQYLPPSSGPSRFRRKKWSRKAGHPYPYQIVHESSGKVYYDRSTGLNPGMAQIDAHNNSATGKV